MTYMEPPMANVDVLAQPFLSLGEFRDHLSAATGLNAGDIKVDGLRVTADPGRWDGPMFLEITTYCRNDKGKRYLDDNDEPAFEVRRFPLTALTLNSGL